MNAETQIRESKRPDRMTRKRVRWHGVGAAVLVMGLLSLFGLVSTDLGLLSILTTAFAFVVLAQAWNLLGGYGGYLNLGMAAFFGIGAYTAGVLFDSLGWNPFATAVIAGLVSAIYGALIGLPTLRLRGPYFAILTLVLTFVVQLFVLNAGFTRGARGIFFDVLPLTPRESEQLFYFIFLGLAALSVLLAWKVERSKFGFALVSVREDEEAAELLGIKTTRIKMQALLIGAFMAGVVGAIFAQRLVYIEPDSIFSINTSIDVVLMTIVGGAGFWLGPVIGVPLIILVSQMLRVGVTRVEIFGASVPSEFNRLVLGVILIVVASYARRGIMGLFVKARGRRLGV